MFTRVAIIAATLAATAATVSADSIADAAHLHHHHIRAPGEEHAARSQLPYAAVMTKRQEITPADSVFSLVTNPPENETAWNEITNAACEEALAKLEVATNPSGKCVCYNLPALDTNTGVFQADLRLYEVSEPRDKFVGIPPENIQVGLSYRGASVSQADRQVEKRHVDGDAGGVSPAAGILTKRSTPKLLQTYLFLGQIDENELDSEEPMTIAAFEALVMPVVTLTGSGSVSTNISMNEAVFLTGVFSDRVILSSNTMAQLEVDKLVEGLAKGDVVFQVPGIRIMIFPIALIITSIWVVIFFAAVGYGTVQRLKYREQFRKRSAQAQKGGRGTI